MVLVEVLERRLAGRNQEHQAILQIDHAHALFLLEVLDVIVEVPLLGFVFGDKYDYPNQI